MTPEHAASSCDCTECCLRRALERALAELASTKAELEALKHEYVHIDPSNEACLGRPCTNSPEYESDVLCPPCATRLLREKTEECADLSQMYVDASNERDRALATADGYCEACDKAEDERDRLRAAIEAHRTAYNKLCEKYPASDVSSDIDARLYAVLDDILVGRGSK